MRNTHLAADRARRFRRQAAQGSATPGPKHNSRSLAGLTFASLGHGNSRARRRRRQNLWVFSSQDNGRQGGGRGEEGGGGGAFVEVMLRMKRGREGTGSKGEKKG